MKKILLIVLTGLMLISCKTKKDEMNQMGEQEFPKETLVEMDKNIIKEHFNYCGERFIDDSNLNPNYENGNGTIISSKKIGGAQTIIRKCEVNDILIGDLLSEENRSIYNSVVFGREIGYLRDNDRVNVKEVCTIAYVDSSSELWYKIETDTIEGWLKVNYSSYYDPYYANRYEIIDYIHGTRNWTVRKMKQEITVTEKLNVRDKPGLEGNKIFLLHDFEEGSRTPFESHNIIAMTEETDIIDGIEDYWLLVEYEKNKYGWIFGGYASQERGGPKYYIPEKVVRFRLSWY